MSTLLLFVDGIGIGEDDPRRNPFAAIGARRLASLAGRPADPEAAARPLDATLGLPGLPQSATGQTTLFTGVNAAELLGRHQTGIPGPTLHPLLEQHSLFVRLVRRGKRPTFANAYTSEHLEAERPRWSATTRMVRASGIPFRMVDDAEPRDEALPHDYTGEGWIARGRSVRQRTASQAAAVLTALLDDHDLVLYEYFLTDLVAHRGTLEQKRVQAERVEALVDAAVTTVDRSRHRVVLVSDHGNLEESDHTHHTRNQAPLLAWGHQAEELVDQVTRFEALTPKLEAQI